MHTTVAQNQAHRTDIAWIKSQGRKFSAAGESFVSEYVNQFTGQVIRKSWKMTGADWFLFSEAGEIVERCHSLTYAKYQASEA